MTRPSRDEGASDTAWPCGSMAQVSDVVGGPSTVAPAGCEVDCGSGGGPSGNVCLRIPSPGCFPGFTAASVSAAPDGFAGDRIENAAFCDCKEGATASPESGPLVHIAASAGVGCDVGSDVVFGHEVRGFSICAGQRCGGQRPVCSGNYEGYENPKEVRGRKVSYLCARGAVAGASHAEKILNETGHDLFRFRVRESVTPSEGGSGTRVHASFDSPRSSPGGNERGCRGSGCDETDRTSESQGSCGIRRDDAGIMGRSVHQGDGRYTKGVFGGLMAKGYRPLAFAYPFGSVSVRTRVTSSGAGVKRVSYVPRCIKPVVRDTMDPVRLDAFLRHRERDDLADAVAALRDIDMFEKMYVERRPERLRGVRSHLPDRIFGECVDARILEPCPRPSVGFCVPLKAVPDRKDPSVGRIILPVCPTNDACYPPPPTPIPHLAALVPRLLECGYIVTADARSWFYSFEVGLAVASKYFLTRSSRGAFFAHRRGPMGFKWMPYLACSVALEIAREVAEKYNGIAFVWIDDFTLGFHRKADATKAVEELRKWALHLRFELRDVAVHRRTEAVGLDLDARRKRWRLAPSWAEAVAASWSSVRTKRFLPFAELDRYVGKAAWSVYARGMPLFQLSKSPRYVGCVRQSSDGDSVVPLPRAVRDELDVVFRETKRNTWLCPFASSAETVVVVSDASVDESGVGWGMIVPRGGQYWEISRRFQPRDGINVEELRALVEAVEISDAAPWTVVITDSQVVFYQLNKFNDGGSAVVRGLLRRLYRLLQQRGSRLVPLWVGTQLMSAYGADSASRADVGYVRACCVQRVDTLCRLACGPAGMSLQRDELVRLRGR